MAISTKSSVKIEQTGFHSIEMAGIAEIPQWSQPTTQVDTQFTYAFETFFHPFVGELISILNRGTLADMMNPETLNGLTDATFFKQFYKPNPDPMPTVNIPDDHHPLPVKKSTSASAGRTPSTTGRCCSTFRSVWRCISARTSASRRRAAGFT